MRPGVWLQIDAEHAEFRIQRDGQMPVQRQTRLGYLALVRKFFRHALPRAFELERAIAWIEDELMAIQDDLPSEPLLQSTDALVRELALVAGVPDAPTMTLSIDAVERVFNRMVDLVEGRPWSQDAATWRLESMAALLVLREIMHHLKFQAVLCHAGAEQPHISE